MAKLSLIKKTRAQIDAVPILEGQLLVATDTDILDLQVDVNPFTRKALSQEPLSDAVRSYVEDLIASALSEKFRLKSSDFSVDDLPDGAWGGVYEE